MECVELVDPTLVLVGQRLELSDKGPEFFKDYSQILEWITVHHTIRTGLIICTGLHVTLDVRVYVCERYQHQKTLRINLGG